MKPFSKKQPKEELVEKAFKLDRRLSSKSRALSSLSKMSIGGYGQKSVKISANAIS